MTLTPAELAALQARLESYYAAETAVLRNQSYKMPDGRELTRASLKEIRVGIDRLRAEIAQAAGVPIVKGRVRRGVVMNR